MPKSKTKMTYFHARDSKGKDYILEADEGTKLRTDYIVSAFDLTMKKEKIILLRIVSAGIEALALCKKYAEFSDMASVEATDAFKQQSTKVLRKRGGAK
jgi:hypothetical protein